MAQRKITDIFGKGNNETPTISPSSSQTNDENNVLQAAEQSSKKSKRTLKFRNEWLSEFSWLRYDNTTLTMHCRVCEEFDSSSKVAFVTGSKNYQRSSLTRHQTSDDHVIANNTKIEKRNMETAVKVVKKKYEPVLEAQLRTALWMAKNNIANRKFIDLVDLQVQCIISEK
jgi:hypothetical protein